MYYGYVGTRAGFDSATLHAGADLADEWSVQLGIDLAHHRRELRRPGRDGHHPAALTRPGSVGGRRVTRTGGTGGGRGWGGRRWVLTRP
ncbi:hypothetical protein ABZ816_05040 [Actinosynnema sp. NPDC047251]